MKYKFVASLLCILCVATVNAFAKDKMNVLPDSCGDAKVTFEVKTEKGAQQSLVPEAGKAIIVFPRTVMMEARLYAMESMARGLVPLRRNPIL